MLGLPGGVCPEFWHVGWGGVGCVNVGVHVYTWYAAGVLMCTHGTWGGVGCVNVGVHVYTWYAAGVLMYTHGTLLMCSCVHMVRCWCVHVYTWYAAGVLMCTHGTWGGVGWGVSTLVFMCTHGTLLVCWCVHMVRCWCVDVYTWCAAGVFMCTHGTLLVCWCVHMVRGVGFMYHVWLSIVSSSWLGSMYFFLPCVSFLSDSFCLLLVYVIYIYIYMYVYFMSVYICMQIVSNGNAVNYRWLLIFPPDLAKKSSLDIVKTFNDQLHLKKKIWSLLVNNHILYEKTQWNQHHDYKNNKRLRILITCSHSRPCSKPGKPPRRSQHVASILLVVYRISLAHLQYFARSIYMEMWNPWLHDNSTHGGHPGTQKTAGHVQVRFRSSLAIWHVLVLGFQGVGTLGFGS